MNEKYRIGFLVKIKYTNWFFDKNYLLLFKLDIIRTYN